MDKYYEEKRQRWGLFNQAWSEPDNDRRMELLNDSLNAHCAYTDQYSTVEGHEYISSYMEGFQKSAPGAKFETLWFHLQGFQCLTAWKLLGADGSVLKNGHGYGRFVNGHKLLVITYFLDTKSEELDSYPDKAQ